MKTEYISRKDNTAIAAVMAAILFAAAGTLFGANSAVAHQPETMAVQKMNAIVVTASSGADLTMDPIVVTSTRVKKTQN